MNSLVMANQGRSLWWKGGGEMEKWLIPPPRSPETELNRLELCCIIRTEMHIAKTRLELLASTRIDLETAVYSRF